MLKRIREKLKSTSAFSLSETLMAVLLLTIVFTAVSGGVVVMQRNYSTIVVRAEQQTTLATAVAVVSADLESATKVKCNSSNIVQCFYCNRRNMYMAYGQGSSEECPREVSENSPTYASYEEKGSISIWPMQGLNTSRVKKEEKTVTIPLLSQATEVFSTGSTTDTKMRTVLSQITVHTTGNKVDYFIFSLAVPAKGAAVNEVQTVYVRPYNDVEIVS